MRKVKFTTETREYAVKEFTINGLFHGFFKTCFDDGEKHVEWTAAFVEDENGKVHKLDTDKFIFIDKPE